MFQTFTGSSRRPRQVNLSGRKPSSSASPSPSGLVGGAGSQAALKHAQQEKLARQRQRLEQNAAINLQRVWRGATTRHHLKSQWRAQWDLTSHSFSPESPPTLQQTIAAISRLHLIFLNPASDTDLARLVAFDNVYSPTLINAAQTPASSSAELLRIPARRLQDMCLRALASLCPSSSSSSSSSNTTTTTSTDSFAASRAQAKQLLRLLHLAVQIHPGNVPSQPAAFFAVLHRLCLSRLSLSTSVFDIIALALSDAPSDISLYVEFVHRFLSQPLSSFDLDRLAPLMHQSRLLMAYLDYVSQSHPSRIRASNSSSALWLLANFIYLQAPAFSDTKSELIKSPDAIIIIARLLSNLSPVAATATDTSLLPLENDEYNRVLQSSSEPLPLNYFLDTQFQSLYTKSTLQSLLVQQNSAQSPPLRARSVTNYIFNLIRVFPSKAAEIRVQLCHLRQFTRDAPAESMVAFLWSGVCDTVTFRRIRRDPFCVSRLLAHYSCPQLESTYCQDTLSVHDDFNMILVFLDLYIFVLQFVSDEDFFGSSSSDATSFRSNPIPLTHLELLVDFLKNLGFALYYLTDQVERDIRAEGYNPDLELIKRLSTSLAKDIHDRDSRRHFFKRDQWLMTDHIDVQGFIKDAMFEEEARRNPQYDDDDDQDDNEDANSHDNNNERHEANDQYTALSRRSNFKRPSLLQGHQHKFVTPRWQILQHMPFLLPFETRVVIFRNCVEFDQSIRRMGHIDTDVWRNAMMYMSQGDAAVLERHHAKVRRKHEFQDAFDQLYALGDGLKEPIQVTFVDEFDIAEAGIDGGGVTKEFLTNATAQAFSPDAGLFRSNSKHLVSPEPMSFVRVREVLAGQGVKDGSEQYKASINEFARTYEFLGRVLGKCLYEGILVDITFAGFFLLKWSQEMSSIASKPGSKAATGLSLNELREYDEDLYHGLQYLQAHPNEAEDLGLTFSVTDEIRFNDGTNKIVETPIVPNGANTPVTKANYTAYIIQMCRFRLAHQIELQSRYFLLGLHQIIDPHWLSMFNQSEIQTLIGGESASIDVADLRRNTTYGGVYMIGDDGQEHVSVQHFWNVMRTISDTDRRKVLKFVTSTPRAPLLGFASLNPRFSIRDSGADQTRFPTTSTCVNLLKLPRYESEAVLREKLLYAVNSGAGFDLS